MFEWHGWATVRASAWIEDDQAAEEEQRAAERRVAALINEATGADNATVDVRDANGSLHVWLAGHTITATTASSSSFGPSLKSRLAHTA